jgi:hypothetical protein
MPSERPKGQHFVHRAYLEGFQDSKLLGQGRRALWVYMHGKNPIPQAPERVAKRNYYYCFRKEEERQFLVEHTLQKLEDAALPILLRLRDEDFSLSQEDRLTFAGYVALTHTRVPTFENAVNKLTELMEARRVEFIANNRAALESVVARIGAETGEKLDVEEFHKKLTGGSVVVKQTDRGWSLKQMVTSMMSLQKLIFVMHWCFMRAPVDDDGFLTSDNPVSLFDPVGNPLGGIGFASSPAAHFLFPISKQICLLAEHSPNPPSVGVNASRVRRLNKGTITRADRQVYAPFNSAAVRKLFDFVYQQKNPPRRILFKHGRVVEE